VKKVSRLTALHVNIIGAVALLLISAIIFFAMIKPRNEEKANAINAAAAAEQGGGSETAKAAAKKEWEKSKLDTVQITKDWMVYSRKYMPTLNWGKDNIDQYFLHNPVNDLPTQWGKWVTNWYDAQAKDGITRDLGQVFPIPSLATDPNGIAALTTITLPSAKGPWQVSVTCKSFDAAMAHLRKFNGMMGHGVPVVNNVTLSGQSPELHLNYDLALFIIPNNPPPPADPRIGGGGAAAGGGGGFGGGFGGGGGPMTGGPPVSGGMMGKGGKN
jgi:uncharacterized membrane protein YgcG